MIRKENFKKIEAEVESAVNLAFEAAKQNQKNKNDFILFLCTAHYYEQLKTSGTNPYVVDYQIDRAYDEGRLKFLLEYLNSTSFATDETTDSESSITLELMIYSHMWESKPFLKQLKKLADLSLSRDYDWDVRVPDMGKHDFIRNEIRDVFKSKNLSIHNVITKGFHTSLRNAFAHSEYVIGLYGSTIFLTNYKGEPWEIKQISYDDWTERFCYSFLLAYKFQNKFHDERTKLVNGQPGYEVSLKDATGTTRKGRIIYETEGDSFRANFI